ncbi:hypothetical protein D3C85_396370 [compost metagenome]
MKCTIRILGRIEQEVVDNIRNVFLKYLGEKLDQDFAAAKKKKGNGPRDKWGRLK